MTTSALIMMLSSWALITYYTVKCLVKVLRTPQHKEDPAAEELQIKNE
jgi:hypothetical protein